MRVAILTAVFTRDYGVTRVIAAQLPAFLDAGHAVDVYACDVTNHPQIAGVRVVRVPTHLRGVEMALRHGAYDLIIAHTHPFYALLPQLHTYAFTIAYEHGQPPPELYKEPERSARDALARQLAEVQKKSHAVATISHFAAQRIDRRDVQVMYNGADHLPRVDHVEACADGPIRVLCVSRFGKGEQAYKGLDALAQMAVSLGEAFEVELVGTGPDEEKQKLEHAGLKVRSFCDDRQLAQAYSRCDVLVSLSCFENFNLPLAEAGFYHKPALALDLAAHPEVTPFVFADALEMESYLRKSTREFLRQDGERMFAFVDARFRWSDHRHKWKEWINSLAIADSGKRQPSICNKLLWSFWMVRETMRRSIKAWRRA